jgi:hypothetical protein
MCLHACLLACLLVSERTANGVMALLHTKLPTVYM